MSNRVLTDCITIHKRAFFCDLDWLWILSGFVHLMLSTFIGYRGGKRNKNSWIAFFGILQGILAVLLAMINASDHYSFQRPSALVLATLGNIIINVYINTLLYTMDYYLLHIYIDHT